jgi:hypothetical protein
VEPTKTATGFRIRKRQEKPRLLRCYAVGLQIIGDDRRACLVIGEADKVRNLELFPVPDRYSEGVLTKFVWIEFCSSPLRSKPRKGRAESRSSVRIFYHKSRRMSATEFGAGNRRAESRDGSLDQPLFTCDNHRRSPTGRRRSFGFSGSCQRIALGTGVSERRSAAMVRPH